MRKIVMLFIPILCMFIVSGCTLDEYTDPIEDIIDDTTATIDVTHARSVEGHIKDIEYALFEAEMMGDLSSYDNLTTYNDIMAKLRKDGISLPNSDDIRCEYYKISSYSILEAKKCADKGDSGNENKWHGRTYSYTKNGKTVRDDD